ncbi:MAG: hypothetical protein FWH07_07930, partial [Oscillospiraceae bacterium]|nr:hypothetical protein [Oscillospiraceae bacterium]
MPFATLPNGKQRLKCKECKKTFQQEYSNNVAFVIGTREHEMLLELLALLETLNIKVEFVYTDDNLAYHKYISAKILRTG